MSTSDVSTPHQNNNGVQTPSSSPLTAPIEGHTPMMAQYVRIKAEYPDTLVL